MSCTLLLSKTRTARKTHRCIWCGELIAPHSKYVEHRYVGDDGPVTDRYHPECDDAVVRSGDDVAEGFNAHEQLRGMTMEDSIEEKDLMRWQKETFEKPAAGGDGMRTIEEMTTDLEIAEARVKELKKEITAWHARKHGVSLGIIVMFRGKRHKVTCIEPVVGMLWLWGVPEQDDGEFYGCEVEMLDHWRKEG